METPGEMKFKHKIINLDYHPTIILGICPGNQRKNQRTNIAWEGNRSADLLNEAIKGIDNLILTNVVNINIKNPTLKKLKRYTGELKTYLNIYSPDKVICLGNIPFEIVKKINIKSWVVKLEHPSYIIRFNKDRLKWKNKLVETIKSI